MNIVEPILFQCRLQATSTAMIAPGMALPRISYARLERFIHNIARQAHAHGLARGNLVVLLIEEPILHAAFILGLTHLGIVTLSARDSDLPKQLHIDAAISDKPHFFTNARRIILADMSWTEGDGRPLAPALPDRRVDDEPCRVILTSGTTGDPKAVALTHAMTLRRLLRHSTVFGSKLPECSRIFTDMSLSTSLGFLFLIHALSRGGTLFFRGPDAVETLQSLDLYGIQAMVAAPAALAEFLGLYEQVPSLPVTLDVIVTAGSLLSKSLSAPVRARLCPRLISVYGSTETSMTATAAAHAIENIPGAVGHVTPGVEVKIVDADGNTLPDGTEGHIHVRSSFGVGEYLDDPVESGRVFCDGWFRSGDIGRLNADGLLIISGRAKLVLNLGGDKVSPERIEQVLTALPGVRQAAAFGTPNSFGVEELWAAVVMDLFDEAALRAHCARLLPAPLMPARYVAVDRLPLTAAGKIDRPNLAGMAKEK